LNVQFDERWTGDNLDLIYSAASTLVELNPDAILATRGQQLARPAAHIAAGETLATLRSCGVDADHWRLARRDSAVMA
jgi:hypothetical protein